MQPIEFRLMRPVRRPIRLLLRSALLCVVFALGPTAFQAAQAQSQAQPSAVGSIAAVAEGAPVRLRQPGSALKGDGSSDGAAFDRQSSGDARGLAMTPVDAQASEFESYVERLAGPSAARRFGADLVRSSQGAALESAGFNPTVPADYVIQPGDELIVNLWGSVDADLRLQVDRSGRISIPRVGTMLVAGVRYADLPEQISRRASQLFKNFQVSVSLGQLRGIRIYLTGFVSRPGAMVVGSLTTLMGALIQSGGPSSAGSFRNIELRRGSSVVGRIDLYDLLIRGDRLADRILQPEDVVHVGPVGTQVALIGSVNQPAIFELKPGETVGTALRMAGGFAAVADRSRLTLERFEERGTTRVVELPMPQSEGVSLGSGDVLRAMSAVDLTMPIQLKNKRVRVEGEVMRPGEYVLPANSTVNDALTAAGGLTPTAHVYATEFSRNSVRRRQQENYDRALRDLETDMTRLNSTQRTANADEAAALAGRAQQGSRLIERLRTIKPNGRIVLELSPSSQTLPDLLLEDGDRLYLPPRSATVGVFGSVYNAGSYLFTEGRMINEYLSLAGGPTKGADAGSAIVVRANGSVVSSAGQRRGWLGQDSALGAARAEAGDTVFVPEELEKSTFVQGLKDWTQILYNFGIGAAAIKAVFN